MSLPEFCLQGSLYSVDMLLDKQCPDDDRFRLFATHVRPLLVKARPALEAAYCLGNGRPGIEPVLLLGVSVLQFMERLPDRQAAEMAKYHLGWKLALRLEMDLSAFDPLALSGAPAENLVAEFNRQVVAGDLRVMPEVARLMEREAALNQPSPQRPRRQDNLQASLDREWNRRPRSIPGCALPLPRGGCLMSGRRSCRC
jgi:transposase